MNKSRGYSFRLNPRYRQEAEAISIIDARMAQVNPHTGQPFGVREIVTDALLKTSHDDVSVYAPRVGLLTADMVEAIVNQALEAQQASLIVAINDTLATLRTQGYSVKTEDNQPVSDDAFAPAFASQVMKRLRGE